MKVLLCCAICAMCLGSALAAYSSSDYLTACKLYQRASDGFTPDSSETLDIGVCVGYTRGVAETAQFWQFGADMQAFCLPEQVGNDQVIRIAVRYLEDHPEELHISATSTIQLALREAFPCTEGN